MEIIADVRSFIENKVVKCGSDITHIGEYQADESSPKYLELTVVSTEKKEKKVYIAIELSYDLTLFSASSVYTAAKMGSPLIDIGGTYLGLDFNSFTRLNDELPVKDIKFLAGEEISIEFIDESQPTIVAKIENYDDTVKSIFQPEIDAALTFMRHNKSFVGLIRGGTTDVKFNGYDAVELHKITEGLSEYPSFVKLEENSFGILIDDVMVGLAIFYKSPVSFDDNGEKEEEDDVPANFVVQCGYGLPDPTLLVADAVKEILA